MLWLVRYPVCRRNCLWSFLRINTACLGLTKRLVLEIKTVPAEAGAFVTIAKGFLLPLLIQALIFSRLRSIALVIRACATFWFANVENSVRRIFFGWFLSDLDTLDFVDLEILRRTFRRS